MRIFGKGKCKLIANFTATMRTSLPSISLSLYLSLSLSPSVPHAQYRKRFRVSYNSCAIFKPNGQHLLTGAAETVACSSQDCQSQLCADKAHGGAVVLGPLVREAGCQTFQEVLSFSLYYTISTSGDDEWREVSAALPTCLRMLRLLRLCKAIQNSNLLVCLSPI